MTYLSVSTMLVRQWLQSLEVHLCHLMIPPNCNRPYIIRGLVQYLEAQAEPKQKHSPQTFVLQLHQYISPHRCHYNIAGAHFRQYAHKETSGLWYPTPYHGSTTLNSAQRHTMHFSSLREHSPHQPQLIWKNNCTSHWSGPIFLSAPRCGNPSTWKIFEC